MVNWETTRYSLKADTTTIRRGALERTFYLNRREIAKLFDKDDIAPMVEMEKAAEKGQMKRDSDA